MKKFRLLLSATLIVVAIGGAYASTRNTCEYQPQYRLQSGTYVPAGTFGYDYMCWGTFGVCTYWKPYHNDTYVPCRYGFYYGF